MFFFFYCTEGMALASNYKKVKKIIIKTYIISCKVWATKYSTLENTNSNITVVI